MPKPVGHDAMLTPTNLRRIRKQEEQAQEQVQKGCPPVLAVETATPPRTTAA